MSNRSTPLLTILVVALLASACAVTIVPGDRVRPPEVTDPVVDRPRPPTPSPDLPGDHAFVRFEVGPNRIYPGTHVYFRVRLQTAGYLTVSALAPDGRVTMLARDVRMEAAREVIFPRTAGDRILASPPEGVWRVRAQWTPEPSDADYRDARGLEEWTAAIAANLTGVEGASVIDAAYEVRVR